MLVDVPDFQLKAMSAAWDKYLALKADEDRTGKASYELYDIEDSHGAYDWLIEHLVKQYKENLRNVCNSDS